MNTNATRRLLALQRTLIPSEFSQLANVSDSSQPATEHLLVLPDGGQLGTRRRTEAVSDNLPSTTIVIGGVDVSTVRQLDRPAVSLLNSAVGMSFEASAAHVPKYPVFALEPPAPESAIAIPDVWATICALFTAYHEQEHVPIVLPPSLVNANEIANYILRSGLGIKPVRARGKQTSSFEQKKDDVLFLSRTTFWQAAGTIGYHSRGWLQHNPAAAVHFPYVPSFTRSESVITSHPLRPPKPSPGELLYRRYCPSVKKFLEFRYFCLDDSSSVDGPLHHLESLHRWHNNPRVAAGWGEDGSLEYHRKYITNAMEDPNVMPVIMSWDGEPMGYLEFFWVKENHLSQYMGGGDVGGAAHDWDRGIHVLAGEDKFKGVAYSMAWLRSAIHYAFLADPRTVRVMGEPRYDNEAIMRACINAGLHVGKIFDFPYKRSALTITSRDRFFQLDLL
ncbi:hypothetical protein CCMSSC00406_0010221 [Pleurotus cornucopiae]|uniref:Uncharacterized protein n=1 Tax=Pleurotus cornucopiae TaxID=5321 RepID=A0ACB7IJS0_PLECO|nr:hypothetical protein CCMSSC00406_0010221 [Pleurotus cornucopiae]